VNALHSGVVDNMAFEKLMKCIAFLGDDLNWWVESLSDETHWETENLSLIDPHQLEYLGELLSPLREYGFQDEIWESAFCKFRIEKELPDKRVQLAAVDIDLADTREKLFLLPYARSDSNERYTELMEHLMQLRVGWLNRVFDLKQPLEVEDVELCFRDREREKYLNKSTVHVFEEVVSILEYIPDKLDSNEDDSDDLEEDTEEDSEEDIFELEEEDWDEELKKDISRLEEME
jgi:hypothetical protein